MLEEMLKRYSGSKPSRPLVTARPLPLAEQTSSVVESSTKATALVFDSTTSANEPRCSKCGSGRLWRTRHQRESWNCLSCDPPPSAAFIFEECGIPRIVSSIAYAVGAPSIRKKGGGVAVSSTYICTRCRSHMVVEHEWSDGRVTFACASCELPIERIVEVHNG